MREVQGRVLGRSVARLVARQLDGTTVSPVAWGQARSISDDMMMMVAGPVGVKWGGAGDGVER